MRRAPAPGADGRALRRRRGSSPATFRQSPGRSGRRPTGGARSRPGPYGLLASPCRVGPAVTRKRSGSDSGFSAGRMAADTQLIVRSPVDQRIVATLEELGAFEHYHLSFREDSGKPFAFTPASLVAVSVLG
ncbi:hypothetical protein TREES_T100018670 [Tupaia chinensis]|uniref:Uncharacterized protein n=1 Tax=Tupaia chinensis TaxID=246437 RepID=L9KMZ0_TUPCH|nr:hypothetical protein TREES_T100018670 [Tupaia chinensis]